MAGAVFDAIAVDGTAAVELGSWVRGNHRFRVRVKCPAGASNLVYVGSDTGVNSATGYWLEPGQTLELEVPPAERGIEPAVERLYARTPTGVSFVVSYAADPS